MRVKTSAFLALEKGYAEIKGRTFYATFYGTILPVICTINLETLISWLLPVMDFQISDVTVTLFHSVDI